MERLFSQMLWHVGHIDCPATIRKKICRKYAIVFGFQLGILLLGTLYIRSKYSFGNPIINYFQFFFLIWPVAFFRNSRNAFRVFLAEKRLSISVYLFIFASFCSTVNSPIPGTSAIMSFLTILCIILISFFAINLQNLEKSIFTVYVYFGLLFCVYLNFTGQTVDHGRLGGVLNPNSIGMICGSLFISSFYIKNFYLRNASFFVFLYTLIMTYSRSAMSGLIVAISLYLFLTRNKKVNYLYISAIMFLLILLILFVLFYSDIFICQFEKLFALNDPYRGVGTGGTGRVGAWKEAWKIFLENPLVGVGYRAHEYYMVSQSSSHNGFLAILAELGIFGFLSAIMMVSFGIKGLLNNISQRENIFKLMIIFSYLIVAIFERYFFNLGNPASLLFIYCFLSGCFVNSNVQPKVFIQNT